MHERVMPNNHARRDCTAARHATSTSTAGSEEVATQQGAATHPWSACDPWLQAFVTPSLAQWQRGKRPSTGLWPTLHMRHISTANLVVASDAVSYLYKDRSSESWHVHSRGSWALIFSDSVHICTKPFCISGSLQS